VSSVGALICKLRNAVLAGAVQGSVGLVEFVCTQTLRVPVDTVVLIGGTPQISYIQAATGMCQQICELGLFEIAA
jgi:hypothetical protein